MMCRCTPARQSRNNLQTGQVSHPHLL
jgi:hypothetical protein